MARRVLVALFLVAACAPTLPSAPPGVTVNGGGRDDTADVAARGAVTGAEPRAGRNDHGPL